MNWLRVALVALCAVPILFSAGCATTSRSASYFADWDDPTVATNVYRHVPEIEIPTWKKFNPVWWFGNADDPKPPASYRPGEKLRVCRWYFRNPCHNFMFYVIGITDKEFVRVGTNPTRTLNPDGGWSWAVCKTKVLRLPCLSYRKPERFDFYFGWRNKGNFGIAIRWKKKEKTEDRGQPTEIKDQKSGGGSSEQLK